jgi:hypothetical protein
MTLSPGQNQPDDGSFPTASVATRGRFSRGASAPLAAGGGHDAIVESEPRVHGIGEDLHQPCDESPAPGDVHTWPPRTDRADDLPRCRFRRGNPEQAPLRHARVDVSRCTSVTTIGSFNLLKRYLTPWR